MWFLCGTDTVAKRRDVVLDLLLDTKLLAVPTRVRRARPRPPLPLGHERADQMIGHRAADVVVALASDYARGWPSWFT